MTYHIQLTTRDGQALAFDCPPEQSLIEAADAACISLPAQCRQGSCGACYASVTEGDYLLGEHNPAALPADDANGILMCCTRPRSDLQIALPFDHAKILFHTIASRLAKIAALERVAENTVRLALRLEPDAESGSAVEFEPGQFVELEIPGSGERRAYSLANTSNWDGLLEFFIRLQPQGRFSSFLRERAEIGMQLVTRGPLGAFGIAEGSLRPRWFVAGGTGLAPMLSMLRRMAEYRETQAAHLFFGVNRESELFALAELDRLQAELPQLVVDVCVWQPQGEWQGFIGTPVDALREALAKASVQPDIYLCGPPRLIDEAAKAAAAWGIPPARVFSERFLSA
jgi:ferredoxin-NADP reductase/ferredoxin